VQKINDLIESISSKLKDEDSNIYNWSVTHAADGLYVEVYINLSSFAVMELFADIILQTSWPGQKEKVVFTVLKARANNNSDGGVTGVVQLQGQTVGVMQ
jgi:hypothetical protein